MANEHEVPKAVPELEAFLREFDECAITPTRKLIAAYVKGQLGSLPRKSVMPIARAAGIAPRTLQELLSLHRWDEELFRTRVQRRARRVLGAVGGTALLHSTFVPKRGIKTPGVDRQDRPSTARRPNGCVIVHLTLAAEGNWTLFDGELYLPRSWTENPARLREAGIPPDTAYRSPPSLGLALLDRAIEGGIRPRWVLFDPAWAAEAGFLAGLHERRLQYAAELPGGTPGYLGSRMAPGSAPRSLLEQAKERTLSGRFKLPSGKDGSEAASFPMGVFPFVPAAAPGPAHASSVAVLRHPWSGEFRFFLGGAPSDEGAEVLIEAAIARAKLGETAAAGLERIGFGHFEVRSFRSLRRHLRLSEASLLFLCEQRARQASGARAVAP